MNDIKQDKLNPYIEKWKEYVYEMKDALEQNDFSKYEQMKSMAEQEYEKYKEDTKMTYECTNFGMAKYVFEDKLPTLFKKNKKAVKEYINTIKEDKNLLAQFHFYKALDNYNCNIDSKDYVNESLKLVSDNINYKTINESNQKLYDIIKKYNIKASAVISDEDLKLYEDCNLVLTHKKKLINLTEITNKVEKIGEYIQNHKKVISEDKKNINTLIEDFDKKYSTLLNEEEKSFVQEIIDAKSGAVEFRQEKLFNDFKNECIKIVNNLLSESNEDTKENLLTIKENLLNKEFCKENLVKDIAKLMEIREVLLSDE